MHGPHLCAVQVWVRELRCRSSAKAHEAEPCAACDAACSAKQQPPHLSTPLGPDTSVATSADVLGRSGGAGCRCSGCDGLQEPAPVAASAAAHRPRESAWKAHG